MRARITTWLRRRGRLLSLVARSAACGVALWTLPGCGIITTDVGGDVRFSFDIDGAGRCLETVVSFDPNDDPDVRENREGIELESAAYYVLTVRKDGMTRRSICAHEDASPVVGEEVAFTATRYGHALRGTVLITTAPTGVAPVCGNAIVEIPSETCDDGSTLSGDGCSATCQAEEPSP
jgi:cysteine-rich repeat protein